MLRAADIMRSGITPVRPETTVEELGRLFIEIGATGLPVADASGTLLGIVTEYDLITHNKRLHIPTMLRIFDAFIPLEGFKSVEKEVKKLAATTVEDIYTKELVTVTETSTLEEIATVMTEHRVHHLPVVRDGKLVGLVEQHDVIRGLSGEAQDSGG
jgi:CBS domain-containing protein